MSIFDEPRINFSGMITLCPGTANNDDYSGAYQQPNTFQNLALLDAGAVQPHDFNGLGDDDFIDWIQHEQEFQPTAHPSAPTRKIIPAEWNYYGDMSVSSTARVTGVQAPETNKDHAALQALVGQGVSWTGNITDVNPEGSPPATQFFAQELVIGGNGIPRQISKGACLWIYFTRNVNLTTDAGAGGYMYHVIPGGHTYLPGFDAEGITGLVFRYCLYGEHGGAATNEDIMKIYEKKGTNPATFQVTGSVAPLFAQETNTFGPVGRFLSNYTPNIYVPEGNANNANNGSGAAAEISLAPAVLHRDGDRVSVDFLPTFPEQFTGSRDEPWDDPLKINPKYAFGTIALEVYAGDSSATIGPVAYDDTAAGNAAGWVFDYDISGNDAAQAVLKNPDAQFRLRMTPEAKYRDKYKSDTVVVLDEEPYYITTNQLAVYGEQGQSQTEFLNQGMPREPITISVYHRGRALSAEESPPISAWRYATTPLMSVTVRQLLRDDLKPGEPLDLQTQAPGSHAVTFSVTGDGNFVPPETYNAYIAPPFTTLTNRPIASLRFLPNEDFSAYWDEKDGVLVGNKDLTFEFVYGKVLRNYYVLFPAMNMVCPLNDPEKLTGIARNILIRTDPNLWMSSGYMPITRDLSESRRNLLQAWCRKVLAEKTS